MNNIKSTILNQFVAMSAKVGHCIDERWILHTLMPSLNPKEQAEVSATIDEMANEDLITATRRAGILTLALSQTGYHTIYPTDPVAAKAKIRTAILKQFSSSSSMVGHCLDERWILHKLIPSLNPKEQEQLDSALKEIEIEGLFTIKQNNGMTILVLTRTGFNTIY